MELLVFVSTQPKNSSVNIDVENDFGLTDASWNGLSETERHEKIAEYVGGFDPVYWDVDEIRILKTKPSKHEQ